MQNLDELAKVVPVGEWIAKAEVLTRLEAVLQGDKAMVDGGYHSLLWVGLIEEQEGPPSSRMVRRVAAPPESATRLPVPRGRPVVMQNLPSGRTEVRQVPYDEVLARSAQSGSSSDA